MTSFTVSEKDLHELHAINLDLAKAPPGQAWRYQARLFRFLEEHPTVLGYCIAAGQEKKARQRSAA